METIQINIGMTNNAMNNDQIVDYFDSMTNYRLMAYYFIDKTFKDEVEPTFAALLESPGYKQSTILRDIENWCSVLKQESIAFKTDKMHALAFNVNYEGESYVFDDKLFESLTYNNHKFDTSNN
jgi:hypothetical protein